MVAFESETDIVAVPLRGGETTEGVSGYALELVGDQSSPLSKVPSLGGSEGPSLGTPNGQGMVLADLASVVVVIDSPQGTTLPFKEVQHAP